jgi:hypothetical protein
MSMTNSESFFEPPVSSSDADEIDSLPSSSTSSSVDDDEYVSDAEREWRESLQQIELLLTMVVVPYVGKYFGRKCAYWGESTLERQDCIAGRAMQGRLEKCALWQWWLTFDRLGEIYDVEIPC